MMKQQREMKHTQDRYGYLFFEKRDISNQQEKYKQFSKQFGITVEPCGKENWNTSSHFMSELKLVKNKNKMFKASEENKRKYF